MVKQNDKIETSNHQKSLSISQKPYQVISRKTREEAVRKLVVEKMTLLQVSKELGIKYCTCRSILKKYQKDGRIGKQKNRRKRVKTCLKVNLSIYNPLTCTTSSPFTFETDNYVFQGCKNKIYEQLQRREQENPKLILEKILNQLDVAIKQIKGSQMVENIKYTFTMGLHCINNQFTQQQMRQELQNKQFSMQQNQNLLQALLLVSLQAQKNQNLVQNYPRIF